MPSPPFSAHPPVPKYVLDTNLYIYATRDEKWNDELQAFYGSRAPSVYMHSVVAGELLTGAIRPNLERFTEERLIAPFEVTGRIITPGHGAWKRMGQIVARLARKKMLNPGGITRSFLNDCLIAASSRDHGLIIITDNTKDFELIRAVSPVDFVAPWPTDDS